MMSISIIVPEETKDTCSASAFFSRCLFKQSPTPQTL